MIPAPRARENRRVGVKRAFVTRIQIREKAMV